MVYSIEYLIRIVSAPNDLVWYSTKIGMAYDCIKEGKGEEERYKIGFIHFIPAKHCEVLRMTKTEKYIKY